MATYNAPKLAQTAGFPSQSSDTILGYIEGLIVGETPRVVTEDRTIAASQTFAAPYVPVGFDGSGMQPFNQAPFAGDKSLIANRS